MEEVRDTEVIMQVQETWDISVGMGPISDSHSSPICPEYKVEHMIYLSLAILNKASRMPSILSQRIGLTRSTKWLV